MTAGAQRNSIPLPELTVPTKRQSVDVQHTPAASFIPGQPLEIAASVPRNTVESLALRLYYRHVNQAERYQSADMLASDHRFRAAIPSSYTNSNYPLQYYFELRRSADNAWLFPGLGRHLQTQHYFVVRPLL